MYAQKSPVKITKSAAAFTEAAYCNEEVKRFVGVSQSASALPNSPVERVVVIIKVRGMRQ